MKSLFKTRNDMIDFLSKILEREKVLTEMKSTVMSIKNDTDIEEELVPTQTHKDKPTRNKIGRLGDLLVDTTHFVLKGVRKFI